MQRSYKPIYQQQKIQHIDKLEAKKQLNQDLLPGHGQFADNRVGNRVFK